MAASDMKFIPLTSPTQKPFVPLGSFSPTNNPVDSSAAIAASPSEEVSIPRVEKKVRSDSAVSTLSLTGQLWWHCDAITISMFRVAAAVCGTVACTSSLLVSDLLCSSILGQAILVWYAAYRRASRRCWHSAANFQHVAVVIQHIYIYIYFYYYFCGYYHLCCYYHLCFYYY